MEAWDNYNFNSTANEVFTGTTGNSSKSMICATATTNVTPASDWSIPDALPVVDGDVTNLLLGDTNWCILHTGVVAQAGTVRFNLNWEVPYDASIPSDMEAVLVIRFSYTGAAPSLTWALNDFGDGAGDGVTGGSEGTPLWTNLAPGVSGNTIKPTDAGATSATVVMHRPVSSTVDCGEVWVV